MSMPACILKLYTARHGVYSGPGALDITRAGADKHPDALGAVFAPPRWLLNIALGASSHAPSCYLSPPPRRHAREFFRWYADAYLGEMAVRRINQSEAWEALLSHGETHGSLTLLCFCSNASACHRVVLARYLAEMWPGRVSYEGERQGGADQ